MTSPPSPDTALLPPFPDELQEEDSTAEEELLPVIELLRNGLGIDFSGYKSGTVGRRIRRRMEFCQEESPVAYGARLAADSEELEALGRDLLIGVTEFFRDTEIFLRVEEMLREMLRDRPAASGLRIWSAGCASGEEAYSLAMLAQTAAEAAGFTGDIKVFATDLHKGALAVASAGSYPREALQSLPQPYQDRFLRCEADDRCRIDPALRRCVVFAQHNLLADPPFTRIDLAVCRNLLIYLRPTAQIRALSALYFALNPDGLLFLGPSEGVAALEASFSPLDTAGKLFRKIPHPQRQIGAMPAVTWVARPFLGESLQQTHRHAVTLDRQLIHDYDELLRRYMPPGFLVNEQSQILHFFGDLTPYLKVPEGRAEGEMLRIVRDELRPALTTALHRAVTTRTDIRMERQRIERNGELRQVDILVRCLKDDKASAPHYQVSFEPSEQQPPLAAVVATAAGSCDALLAQRANDLEEELQFTRHSLQLTIEELQASNEKLDLANEELVSSNEELQSTNEELKSVNEDIYAVNAELEARNRQLTQLNRDHDNLLASTEVGTVFLDAELRVRKFSPAITSFLKLLPQDIGRPIDHIAYALTPHSQFLEHLRSSLSEGVKFEKEVRVGPDQWVLKRILPFRTERGTVDGVVLTFTDISAIKLAQRAVEELNSELEGKVVERTRALAESEARVRDYIENAGQGFWQVGPDRLTNDVNPTLCRMLGYERHELLGRSPLAFAAPESLPLFTAQMTKIDQSVHRNYEITLRHKGGHPIPVLFHATTHRDRSGEIDSAFAFVTDLSEQKRADEERLKLQRMIEASLNEIYAFTTDTLTFAYVSPSALRNLGYEMEQMRAMTPVDIKPEMDDQTFRATVAPLLSGMEGQLLFQTVHRRADGSDYPVEVHLQLVPDGERQLFLAMIYDISDRKAAEEALAMARHVLDKTADAIFWSDEEGRFVYVNDAACDSVGYRRSELLTMRVTDIDRSHGTDKFEDFVQLLRKDRAATIETVHTRKDGGSFPVELVVNLMKHGGRRYLCGFARDITLRRQTEESLRQAKEAAEAATRAKNQFLANISHEVRTPLTGIMGMSQLLHLTPLSEEQLEYLQNLDSSSQSLLVIINDLLDLTRIEAGKVHLEQSLFRPRQLAEEVLQVHGATAQRKGIALGLKLEDTLPPRLKGVPQRLKQVLHNLVGNAVKFTDQGTVTLSLQGERQEGETLWLRCSVRDTGIGIPSETLARLFTPFTQADSSISRLYGGTGLGLAICRRMTELMGGSIEVESTPGVGSCFTILLPVQTATDAATAPSQLPDASLRWSGEPLRILLAEDQTVSRNFATRLLERLGHQVVPVEEGAAALAAWQQQPFDLILMDVQMPGMDGLAATAAIRAAEAAGRSTVPIIALTAHALTGDREHLLSAGFNGYVAKPIDLELLLAEISRLLGEQRHGATTPPPAEGDMP